MNPTISISFFLLSHIIIFSFLFTSCSSQDFSEYKDGITKCNEELNSHNKSGEQKSFNPECIIGYSLPEINRVSMDGTLINSYYFENKTTIINFWFSACAPCMAEIPGFNEIVEKYGSEDVNYLALGRDQESEIKFVLEHTPWKFKQISNASDLIDEVFLLNWGYPTTYIVNKEGIIIHAIVGGSVGPEAPKHIQNKIIPILEEEL